MKKIILTLSIILIVFVIVSSAKITAQNSYVSKTIYNDTIYRQLENTHRSIIMQNKKMETLITSINKK